MWRAKSPRVLGFVSRSPATSFVISDRRCDVDPPLGVGADRGDLEPSERDGSRIRSVGRVGIRIEELLRSLLEVLLVDHDARDSPCPRRGWILHVHPADLGHYPAISSRSRGCLGEGHRRVGVQTCGTIHAGRVLVDLGVVLHRAGPQGVEAHVYAEIPAGQTGECRTMSTSASSGRSRSSRRVRRDQGFQGRLRDVACGYEPAGAGPLITKISSMSTSEVLVTLQGTIAWPRRSSEQEQSCHVFPAKHLVAQNRRPPPTPYSPERS